MVAAIQITNWYVVKQRPRFSFLRKILQQGDAILRSAPLETKFILAAFFCITTGVSVAGISIYSFLKRNYLEEQYSEIKDLTVSAASSFTDFFALSHIGVDADPYIHSSISKLKEIHKNRIMKIEIFQNNSDRIISTEASASSLRHLDLPKPGSVVFAPESPNATSVITPLNTGSFVWGYLIITFSLEHLHTFLQKIRIWYVCISFMFLLIGMVLSAFAARQLARPVKALSAAMSKVDPAVFQTDLIADRADELGVLQNKFLEFLDRLRKKEEERVLISRKMVQAEKLAAIGSLTAGIAHEINNPVAGALSCITTLRQRCGSCTNASRYLEAMEHSLTHAGTVIRELLDFSRERSYNLTQSVLQEIIGNALSLVKPRFDTAGVAVRLQVPEHAIDGVWDPTALEQVFVNLILNAFDAVDPQKGIITVWAEKIGSDVHIDILDNGTGLGPQELNCIFEPFFTTKDPGHGTGLGLAVCQKIIQDHRGTIIVKSEKGMGTTVSIVLPCGAEGNT